ncbi:Fpg/Nei family DNA glycosylase [Propionicimonas sp.]|uniref:Fpg/Nei family DNA glycosylase n=1 Tax=Propionicimonas sp. TaxID=1955623 RepID=UPI0039E63C81
MPEGDTVFRTCARLDEALAGRALVAAELRWPGLSTADLTGTTVTAVVPRGKHILIRLASGWTLHSHLKMEGQWRIERSRPARGADAWARSVDIRAILVTPEWTAIGLRLGRLDLVRTSEEDTLVGHLGPDILAADFDPVTAVANLAASGTSIGAALLDQRNLAGVGTMWAAESLFLERVNPWAEQLEEVVIARVVERARRLMTAAVGSARQSSTGSTRPGESTWVHARSGRPCRRCGATIRVAPIGPPARERVLFSCPACQGGRAPGDDGHPIAPLGARGGRRGRREPR